MGVTKTKTKGNIYMKRLSFTTELNLRFEFLLLFTRCRKVLGKIPGIQQFLQHSKVANSQLINR